MKSLIWILVLISFSSLAQNKHFRVYKFDFGQKDSVLDWEYQTNQMGKLLWEKHNDGEEINYKLEDGLIVKADQCFTEDSCFTFRYLYEDGREIYRYSIDHPAYFDSIPIKISVRTEYADSLTRISHFRQEGAERFTYSMSYRITKTSENTEEHIAFDENGKAYFFAYKEVDKYGPVKLETAWIKESEGRVPLAVFKRYPVLTK